MALRKESKEKIQSKIGFVLAMVTDGTYCGLPSYSNQLILVRSVNIVCISIYI